MVHVYVICSDNATTWCRNITECVSFIESVSKSPKGVELVQENWHIKVWCESYWLFSYFGIHYGMKFCEYKFWVIFCTRTLNFSKRWNISKNKVSLKVILHKMTSEKRQPVLQKNSQHLYVEYADNWELLLRRKNLIRTGSKYFQDLSYW